MRTTENVPADLVRGTFFIMLYKKGQRDDFGKYRAISLVYHAYKLLSAIMARRLMKVLDGHLPDTRAGFRPARGCRDRTCALRWFIAMVLREGRHAIITFIVLRSTLRVLADAGGQRQIQTHHPGDLCSSKTSRTQPTSQWRQHGTC